MVCTRSERCRVAAARESVSLAAWSSDQFIPVEPSGSGQFSSQSCGIRCSTESGESILSRSAMGSKSVSQILLKMNATLPLPTFE